VDFPQALLEEIRNADSVVVLTGAGISAESGIPTFRQAQTGLWARYDPHELATPEAFTRNPKLVWSWYAWRRELVRQSEPNDGHRALVQLEGHAPHFLLITQNVDGLHERAGSRHVIELHGNLNRVCCSRDRRPVESWDHEAADPPACRDCGALLRPDVVWFGESLPAQALEIAFEAAQTCQLFFSVGTSTLVQPAASLPFLAQQSGATIIEVNPQETPLSAQADYSLRGPAGVVLLDLVEKVWPREGG
jgi:NAD-dependent deacetylase